MPGGTVGSLDISCWLCSAGGAAENLFGKCHYFGSVCSVHARVEGSGSAEGQLWVWDCVKIGVTTIWSRLLRP